MLAAVKKKDKELKTKEKKHERECNYLEAKIEAKTGELDMSHQHVMELKTKHRSTNDMANQKQKK